MAGGSGPKIVRSTLELLRTRGPAGVTIESVAAHSGVARTTIYRRYRNRNEMLGAALLDVAVVEPPDVDLPAEARLRWVVSHAASMVLDGIGFGGMAALLTDSDPEFGVLFRQVLARHRAELREVLDAGKRRGQFAATMEPEMLVDGIVGALVAERARTGGVAGDWEDRVVTAFAPMVFAAESDPRRRSRGKRE